VLLVLASLGVVGTVLAGQGVEEAKKGGCERMSENK
jgi:hypothetical protein